MSKFEFDEDKCKINELRHGINFETAKKLWLDSNLIVGPATSVAEERWAAIGKIDDKCWLAIFTYRGSAIRLITCRRARLEEVLTYEESK